MAAEASPQPRRPVVAMLKGVDGRRGSVGHQWCGTYVGRKAMVRRLKNGTKDSLTESSKMAEMCWSGSESPLLSRRHKCLRRNASASLAGALVQQLTDGRAHLYVRLRCIGVSSPLYRVLGFLYPVQQDYSVS